MKKAVIVLVFQLFIILYSKGQLLVMPQYGGGARDTVLVTATAQLDDGEIVPVFPIDEVVIRAIYVWKSEEDRQRYFRLKRNVLRVLPYAIYAQKRYQKLDVDLAAANSKREQKRLIKLCEEEIKNKFNTEIKNLSISQGKILVKLIERQTGNTSYDLVKEMKGSMTAFLYQGIAKIFGHNLKSTYNAQEDVEIENIIRSYERVRPMSAATN